MAGFLGGTYAAVSHFQEISQPDYKGITVMNDTTSTTGVQSQQSDSATPPTAGSKPSAVGVLTIIDSSMYYHAPSIVTVKNSGTDEILLQRISYGQTNLPGPDDRLQPGEQLQLTFPQINGAIGSRYNLQIQGVSVTAGKLVTAQATAVLREPASKMEVTYSLIDMIDGGGYPILKLTILNSGMDMISIVGIECEKPIPVRLWADDGQRLLLQPSEERTLDIQLDSMDYIGTKRVSADGTVSYLLPQAGSTKLISIDGENSLGRPVSTIVAAPVAVSQVQVSSNELTGTR